jgi:Raf kinase inhibitor-like YbhB/YbcL family protein
MPRIPKIALAAALLLVASAAQAQSFQAESVDLPEGAPIAQKFTYQDFGCRGSNLSPALAWTNAPAGTKSFAVSVHDPDAPTGGAGFWHWIVIDLPATASGLPQGSGAADGKALPAPARQLASDFGTPGWGGPCPPAGDKPHHYVFTVYALSVEKLDLPARASPSLAASSADRHSLAKASFTRLYGR